ncbi:hypothetical protein V8C86DRAFT_648423 [Haematococcus lacustris]
MRDLANRVGSVVVLRVARRRGISHAAHATARIALASTNLHSLTAFIACICRPATAVAHAVAFSVAHAAFGASTIIHFYLTTLNFPQQGIPGIMQLLVVVRDVSHQELARFAPSKYTSSDALKTHLKQYNLYKIEVDSNGRACLNTKFLLVDYVLLAQTLHNNVYDQLWLNACNDHKWGLFSLVGEDVEAILYSQLMGVEASSSSRVIAEGSASTSGPNLLGSGSKRGGDSAIESKEPAQGHG